MGKLTVYLDKINNLKDEDDVGSSDPYVKFEVKEDKFGKDEVHGHDKSSKKRDDPSPVYGETFSFANLPDLNNMILHVTVMDDDLVGDDELGSCKIKLESLGLSSTPKEVVKTIDRHLLSKSSKVHLKLSWTE